MTALAFAPAPALPPLPPHTHLVSSSTSASACASSELDADRYLVTVSRDQTFALWRREGPRAVAAAATDSAAALSPPDAAPAAAGLLHAATDSLAASAAAAASAAVPADELAERAAAAATAAAAAAPVPRFALAAARKAHSRQVQCVCWLPDASGFVTASRDRTVTLWRITESANSHSADSSSASARAAVTVTAVPLPAQHCSVTALASAVVYVPLTGAGSGDSECKSKSSTQTGSVAVQALQVLLMGLEDGTLRVLTRPLNSDNSANANHATDGWVALAAPDARGAHSGAITRISVAPAPTVASVPSARSTGPETGAVLCGRLMVATASEDHSVRVAAVDFEAI